MSSLKDRGVDEEGSRSLVMIFDGEACVISSKFQDGVYNNK